MSLIEKAMDKLAGREPREPADWGDDSGSDAPPSAGATNTRKDSGSPIGGPAGEH